MEVRECVYVRMCLCVFAYIMRRVIHDKEGRERKVVLQKCQTFDTLKRFAVLAKHCKSKERELESRGRG